MTSRRKAKKRNRKKRKTQNWSLTTCVHNPKSISTVSNFSIQGTVASANKASAVALADVVTEAEVVLAFLDQLKKLSRILSVENSARQC